MGLVVGWPPRRMGQQMVGEVARGLSLFGGASSEAARFSTLAPVLSVSRPPVVRLTPDACFVRVYIGRPVVILTPDHSAAAASPVLRGTPAGQRN
eukprot:scaffold22957_cov58-Phaeocystis_antarctica.AAC.7